MLLAAAAAGGGGLGLVWTVARLGWPRRRSQASGLGPDAARASGGGSLTEEGSDYVARALSELKQSLNALASRESDPELAARALETANEEALTWLVGLLGAAAGDVSLGVVEDVTEVFALLSPTHRGLQPALCRVGAVQALLRLLASAVEPDDFTSSSSTAGGTEGSVGVRGREGAEAGPLPLSSVALAQTLRALVNLTSNPRGGSVVRQAVLKHERALAALCHLLASAAPMPLGRFSGCGPADAPASATAAASSSSAPAERTREEILVEEQTAAAGWQVSGLAAWLVAHLCGAPQGQLALVQEGVVPLLVRLLRHGRYMACRKASAAAGRAQHRAWGDGPATTAAGEFDTQEMPFDLPYIICTCQYALMALVNITYDHSANQRTVAVSGALAELAPLLDELLPGGSLSYWLGLGLGPDAEPPQAGAVQLAACSSGLAKYAVWLLAHLSSSDPDLKAAIAGRTYGFVPQLISCLLLPPGPGGQAPGECMPPPAAAAALAVQQYAAMCLVNLTCGVPATKAAVAEALRGEDSTGRPGWQALAALLNALAEATIAYAPPPGASDPGSPSAPSPPPPPPPVADLLLYSVWLLQHLSLSPLAAAAADPGVVSPLAALLAASDPHVRLRSAAALGSLCSVSSTPHRAAFVAAGGVTALVTAAAAERDPHLLAYELLCLAAAVGDDDSAAVAEAVAAGALGVVEGLLGQPHAACLIPAAEVLQALARAARGGVLAASRGPSASAAAAAAAVAEAAADVLPRSLLSRVVAVMLTHGDPRVRSALNEALGALTALPGVRDSYCAVFAETLRDLVSAAEVELRVIPVN
ncbi:hypothetical protein HYH03_011030 [Edaphochlamys debaryana]|uniref:Vacuolar protein 8 n=1 Tax=Edaphochlamys debaryana TaxID=47281 RepID=A0A835Y414_9CHLO|nr:hypothetical protein HYH03_011030 [Edaphochlamys debaryana]|eukprot:KAG2490639.1 hypothetical protein HYH03_011030 [Edaphochlamys debaryana]